MRKSTVMYDIVFEDSFNFNFSNLMTNPKRFYYFIMLRISQQFFIVPLYNLVAVFALFQTLVNFLDWFDVSQPSLIFLASQGSPWQCNMSWT